MKGGWRVEFSPRFVRDFKRLPVGLQKLVDACVEDFAPDPIPSARRPHGVSPAGHRPQVFSVDVTPNKAYKISFEISGDCVILRRVATHQEIDRAP